MALLRRCLELVRARQVDARGALNVPSLAVPVERANTPWQLVQLPVGGPAGTTQRESAEGSTDSR